MSIFKFLFKYAYAFVFTIFLFTIGWLWEGNRKLILSIYSHFHWKVNAKPPQLDLPLLKQNDMGLSSEPLHIIKQEGEDGNTSLLETVVISKLVQSTKPQTIFEVGTFNGRTTLHMAANANPETKIYTLDLPQEELANTKYDLHWSEKKYAKKPVSGEQFLNSEYQPQITQLFGDSATFDFSRL